ncbi:MAG: tRNA pseudouridine(38-40) synthase TruA [Candidatus Cloacimonetes bacterium]|nr:tRNA pseudouridine(38-40) synthase TruA [Candidatus Cloacimonadota bacterium]
MTRYLVQFAYNGRRFHGWQRQFNALTVQETIENALEKIAKTPISITGSGRTDTGVHALCQFAHFDLPYDIPPERLKMALITAIASYDVRPIKVWQVSTDFHARYWAYERSYRYIITRERTPFNAEFKSYLPHLKLHPDRIREALPLFLGSHDFLSFSKPNPDVPNTVCDLKRLTLDEAGHDLIFHITADRFLHNMVRRIVGCVASISGHNLNPSIITDFLEGRKGDQKILFTAPPNGLYLIDVKYPDKDIVPDIITF